MDVRNDEECNLDRGPDSHTDREVQFILHRNCHRCDVLGGVTHDRQKDKTDPFLRNVTGCRQTVDGTHKEFSGNGNEL